MPASKDLDLPQLLYSCHSEKSRESESFVRDHVLIRIFSGEILFQTTTDLYHFSSGNTILIKRNQLVKVTKVPPAKGSFESVSVYFSQAALRDYATENKVEPQPLYTGPPVVMLTDNLLYASYASSLAAYQQGETNKGLTTLKVKEALMLMLLIDKGAADLLFDFHEPGKIDLEGYMNTHFRYNVGIHRLAYLTGRSLATFKRDFTKVFNTSPNKWLQHRRLNEAHYLIKEKKMKPSAVYLEVGFEDLSHFSYAFKNQFGKSPSFI